MILGVDPSSTCTGWAIVNDNGTVTEHGRIKPSAKLNAFERTGVMCARLSEIVKNRRIPYLVIEQPSGRRMRGNPFPYAIAFGRIYQAIEPHVVSVTLVTASQWSKSRDKKDRAERIKEIVPTYTGQGDAGFDEADAIGIALWGYWQERSAAL